MLKISPKAKKVLEITGNFIFSFVTALVVIVAIAFVAVKLLGWNLFSIDSGSMEPLYPVDTLVVVQDVKPEEIDVGDVVTYVLNEDGVLVTHRVVAINPFDRTFTTKGDANNSEDAPVLWDNVVGKVLLGVPFLGKPMRYLTNPDNRPVIIGIIIGLFAISFVWDFAVRRKKKHLSETAPQDSGDNTEDKPEPTTESENAADNDTVSAEASVEDTVRQ